MSGFRPGSEGSRPARIFGVAGWSAVAVLLFLAALWASEPGGADPAAPSWNPGSTVTTWDWERHWNYWMRWLCAEKGFLPSRAGIRCIRWSQDGPVWKPCGPEIRPPEPGRTNSCNIGQAGGHEAHGDDLNEKYTYLGLHEDRTGPTYAICEGDPDLPADTSPDNCGTWVTTAHDHCPGEDDAHPPDCPSPTIEPPTSTRSPTVDPPTTTPPNTGPPTTGSLNTGPPTTSPPPIRPPNTGPPPTGPPITSPPSTGPPITLPEEPWACYESEVDDALHDAMENRPRPGLGLRPAAHGYVGVPMEASYTADPVDSFTVRIGGDRVYVRMWVSLVSWSFTDLGTIDGVQLGSRSFRRHAPTFRSARLLRSPATVSIAGETAVYRRSSSRSGYATGYPVVLGVTWTVECRQRGVAGWTELSEENRRYRHHYKVYAIRSRSG